nr:uncharacterized protein LOC113694323 isoform X2 [Coffea arabica]
MQSHIFIARGLSCQRQGDWVFGQMPSMIATKRIGPNPITHMEEARFLKDDETTASLPNFVNVIGNNAKGTIYDVDPLDTLHNMTTSGAASASDSRNGCKLFEATTSCENSFAVVEQNFNLLSYCQYIFVLYLKTLLVCFL